MAVIDGVFCLDARLRDVAYERETLSVVTLECREITVWALVTLQTL